MKRRVLSLLLALMMILTLVPVSIFAAEEADTETPRYTATAVADDAFGNGTASAKFIANTESGSRWKLTTSSFGTASGFTHWTWSSASDASGGEEKLTDRSFEVELTEDRTYTAHYAKSLKPEIKYVHLDGGEYSVVIGKDYVGCDTDGNTIWNIRPGDYIVLKYIEDDAGNRYEATESSDKIGIKVSTEGQVFTAYVTRQYADLPHLADGDAAVSMQSGSSKFTVTLGHPVTLSLPFDECGYAYTADNATVTLTADGEQTPFWRKTLSGNSLRNGWINLDLTNLHLLAEHGGGTFTASVQGKTRLDESFSTSHEYTVDLNQFPADHVNNEIQPLNSPDAIRYITEVVTATDSATQITNIYLVAQTTKDGYQVYGRNTVQDTFARIPGKYTWDTPTSSIVAICAEESGVYVMANEQQDVRGYYKDNMSLYRLNSEGTFVKVAGSDYKKYSAETNSSDFTFPVSCANTDQVRGMAIINGKVTVFSQNFTAVWSGSTWTAAANPEGLTIAKEPFGSTRRDGYTRGVFKTDLGYLAVSSKGGIWRYAGGAWSQLTWSTNEGVNEGLDPNTKFAVYSAATNGNLYVRTEAKGDGLHVINYTVYRVATARLTDSACVTKVPIDTRYASANRWESIDKAGEDFNGQVYVYAGGSASGGVGRSYFYSVNMETGLWELENIGGDFYAADGNGNALHATDIECIFNPVAGYTIFGASENSYALDALPTGSVDLAAAIETAKASLKDYLQELGEDNYGEENLQKLLAAYEAGLAAIGRAEDVAAVKAARDAAKKAMKAIKPDLQGTKTVWVSFSNDGNFLVGNDANSTVMGAMKVTVNYFDLADYGLEGFYRYDDEGDVIEQPTALHLYIKLLEQYYMGYTGNEKIVPGETQRDGDSAKALLITGTATSMYMSNFWGHDENLSYFVNHEYPLMRPGWGSTADWILLENGDYVELAMYTDWSFYIDPNAGFPYFKDTDGNDVSELTASSGGLILHRATADMNGGRGDVIGSARDIYYTPAAALTSDVTKWTRIGTTDQNGQFHFDFTHLDSGDYYLGTPGSTVSAPAAILVHVENSQSSTPFQSITLPDGTELKDVAYTENGFDYYGEKYNLYTVKVPAGTTSVNLNFAEACKGHGTYANASGYLGIGTGAGNTVHTITVDYNNDGSPDFYLLQLANASGSMNTPMFAIGFEVEEAADPFQSITLPDGTELKDVAYTENGFDYYGEKYNLYTVKVPAGTTSVNLNFAEACKGHGTYANASGYLGIGTGAGNTVHTITVDYNNDGSPDFYLLQLANASGSMNTPMFAIGFEIEAKPIVTVTFDANGGDCSVASSVCDQETGKLSALPEASWDGWRFDGWFTAPDGGEKITPDTVFKDNTIVYAHWTSLDKIAADYVRGLIESLDDITLNSKEKIEAARAAYDALTPNQRNLISKETYRKLTDAEAAYAALVDQAAAEAVEDLIDAIGPVTKKSGEKINVARSAYDALTDAQRKLVTNYQTLLDAEKRYKELTRPVTPVTPSKPAEEKPAEEKPTGDASKLPFRDVTSGSWYYDGVQYAYENGLMNGTGANAFSPNADTTRGMIVTILARLEGVDTSGGAAWYARGREWAMTNDISDGTNMEGAITREQLAAILFRYAQLKGMDAVTLEENLGRFTDRDRISAYAVPAMNWAVGQGLLQGAGGRLDPQGTASRAQVATILMRFLKLISK